MAQAISFSKSLLLKREASLRFSSLLPRKGWSQLDAPSGWIIRGHAQEPRNGQGRLRSIRQGQRSTATIREGGRHNETRSRSCPSYASRPPEVITVDAVAEVHRFLPLQRWAT